MGNEHTKNNSKLANEQRKPYFTLGNSGLLIISKGSAFLNLHNKT